jgi:predicted 3-demethylubiquinone-9 3-methyltransferase (glyoxalase superfamily)
LDDAGRLIRALRAKANNAERSDMKDIYSCLWFDNRAEAAVNLYLEQLLSDPDKKTNRVMKALLQMGKLDMQGSKNAVAA